MLRHRPSSTFRVLMLNGTALLLCAHAGGQTFRSRTWQVGPDAASDVAGTYLSQTSKSVKILLSGGTSTTLEFSSLSDEDLRYLLNIRAVSKPYRTWTRTARDRFGATLQETFEAAIIDVKGFDSPISRRHVLLVRSDAGQKKGYALADLGTADQAYVDSVASQFPDYPASHNGSSYAINKDEQPHDPHFNSLATDHFIFYWGDAIKPEASNWNDSKFREMNFAYFEKVWDYYLANRSTLPYWNVNPKYKTSVYITETGLKDYPDGFAFGGKSVVIAPAAMLQGSSVIPHEFGHTNQFWSGGFRSDKDAEVNAGWLWECNANWNAGMFVPGIANALGVYAERGQYELDSSRMNYGSWPWLEAFASQVKFGPSFPIDMFREAKRDASGNTTETPFEAVARLGVERGAFSGTGWTGFGDVIGEMAAHNAAWDYTYQQDYLDTLRYLFTSGVATRAYTYLEPVVDAPNSWRPIYSQAPRQFGENIVPLEVASGTAVVSIKFEPIVDETLQSDWRETLVAVDKFGNARYSRMSHRGLLRFPVQPGEQLYLAIAATPKIYSRQPFRPGYGFKRRFPYQVEFTNCKPLLHPPTLRTHTGTPGHAHPNGGGFVADSARVDSGVYVGPEAQILDRAQVGGTARIEGHATVCDDAQVGGAAVVEGYAVIRESAAVRDNARVREYAVVQQHATIAGSARVREFINVQGDGVVQGDAMVKGFGDVYTAANKPVGGGTVIGQDAEIYFGDYPQTVEFGTLYGFNNGGIGLPTTPGNGNLDPRTDNKYLYAHWGMTRPRKQILIDEETDNDGVLHDAVFQNHALDFNGKSAYATIEGHAMDANGITLDIQAMCRSTKADQRIFTFVGPDRTLSFAPRDATGNAALVFTHGDRIDVVHASKPMPIGAFVRVTVVLAPKRVRIFLNGEQIADSADLATPPGDLGVTAGFIGKGIQGQFFDGQISDMAIYRKAFSNFADLVPPYSR